MKILEQHSEHGWITAIIQGRWVQAKVYDEPSTFGINDGRVSKCCISKTNSRDKNKNFFDQMDYNYNRGEDFNNLSPELLEGIIEELESLPKTFSREIKFTV